MDPATRARGTEALSDALGSRTAAEGLEEVVFCTHGFDAIAYSERVRELVHCKDRVKTLCETDCVLAGAMDTVALRSPTEDQWYKELARAHGAHEGDIAQFESIDLLEGDTEGALSALNVCRGCRSSDVSWYQRQTRSADEGMVTFFLCRSCGKRWKQ